MGYEKMAKICPKCQCPIQIRICIRPCMHYLCYDCYIYNKNECAYCSTVACESFHIGDKDPIYSCDSDCFKVFEDQESLQKHMEDHLKIKAQSANQKIVPWTTNSDFAFIVILWLFVCKQSVSESPVFDCQCWIDLKMENNWKYFI